MQRSNFYAGAGLDRAERLRRDPEVMERLLGNGGARVLALWRSKSLVRLDGEGALRPVVLEVDEAGALIERAEALVFLGKDGGRPWLALDLPEAEETQEALAGLGEFQDLRAFGPLLPQAEGARLAYARGLLHWHRRHRFCGVCGAPTESRHGGHQRFCTNPACAAPHFPRTDPAVIMLIHDGGERCVLGRQKVWLPGMHSTLAGFLEPGESLEEAVAREVEEEVGLVPTEVVYHSSQPWPFPSSLMVGFHARVPYRPLQVDPEELESAQWYDREFLLNSPEDETFRLPRKDSIARRLILDWLGEEPA